ncbi:hypothetical protein [Cognataquiflexum aquatile]|uniref:hypothetical protein n=1 Tax=Cognataquiflexum aquatile TaxID=2249427 RepID=UPI000DE881F7|nr:hypothetical protein [Cognataquiflexum aquatile]
MKNTQFLSVLCFCIILFTNVEFTKAEKVMDPSLTNLEGYFGTIKNQNLYMDLACKFSAIFTEVEKVDVFNTSETGYYYQVSGFKNGFRVLEYLKINPDDLIFETYSYINFENIAGDLSSTQFCYEPFNHDSPNCQPANGCTYIPYPTNCRTFICGVLDYIGGLPYCHIT